MPAVDLSPSEHIDGFEVKAVTPIDELRAVTIELAHQHSGGAAATSLYRRYRKSFLH